MTSKKPTSTDISQPTPTHRIADKSLSQSRSTYHHGALRMELIAAADRLLLEQGIEAFSLREVARMVGVSPAAPAHHFKDSAGLLTEVAILGFKELSRYLEAWDDKAGIDPIARLHSQGQGYIRFALDHPGRFQLMFRKEKLRPCDDLKMAAEKASSYLRRAVCAHLQVSETEIGPKETATILLAWSTVHGFAQLAIAGQFDQMSESQSLDAFCNSILPLIFDQITASRN